MMNTAFTYAPRRVTAPELKASGPNNPKKVQPHRLTRCKCGALTAHNNPCRECWDALLFQAIDLVMRGQLQTPANPV